MADRLWTKDEDRLLGALPDEGVARRVRRHWESVRQCRYRLGIPNSTPNISSPHPWTVSEDKLLVRHP